LNRRSLAALSAFAFFLFLAAPPVGAEAG